MLNESGAISTLGPIDPTSVNQGDGEKEKAAPWVVRKLVGSMTGRIVMSSYESLRATGTSVICLSPWGDSSPLTLPCIRFRDIAVHTVIVATGGFAAVASPVMGPVSDLVVSSFGDTILVELGLHAGFDVTTKVANDLLLEHPLKHVIPIHSSQLETTHVKVLIITLKFKATVEDAKLGFYRSSVHKNSDLFSAVKDYLAVEKGWFSPYLFASARRPIIPRSMKADVVFCHGPFLQGDYRIGETLLNESASVISLCIPSAPPASADSTSTGTSAHPEVASPEDHAPSRFSFDNIKENLRIPALTNRFIRSRTSSPLPADVKDPHTPHLLGSGSEFMPTPALTPLPPPPKPRRMVIVVLGIKPHRKLWTTSARPEESVIQYILLNGCPAVVVPVKVGAPLVAWDALTLEKIWTDLELPPGVTSADEVPKSKNGKFEGMIDVLCEFLELCIDWDRIAISGTGGENSGTAPEAAMVISITEEGKRKAVRSALTLLIAGAVRSRDSKEARKELDPERSGIAMWRIP
ncbi:hypothetical protein Moror_10731 [Moniliophthora roreri MCA 2997]|uniref:Uncharacterized protein n=1 Tax=Moniliophthora roreri (strain MCA 2997) TaxID=1381753 RepID=V2WMJ9_MONRO|nr:hypothetical protein Moror_10731 [Moniliophthora roreri MCA 2997]